jgi:hypothetical protein
MVNSHGARLSAVCASGLAVDRVLPADFLPFGSGHAWRSRVAQSRSAALARQLVLLRIGLAPRANPPLVLAGVRPIVLSAVLQQRFAMLQAPRFHVLRVALSPSLLRSRRMPLVGAFPCGPSLDHVRSICGTPFEMALANPGPVAISIRGDRCQVTVPVGRYPCSPLRVGSRRISCTARSLLREHMGLVLRFPRAQSVPCAILAIPRRLPHMPALAGPFHPSIVD